MTGKTIDLSIINNFLENTMENANMKDWNLSCTKNIQGKLYISFSGTVDQIKKEQTMTEFK